MVDHLSVRESGYLAPRQLLAGPGVSGSTGAALRDWGIVQGHVVVVADRLVSEAGLLSPLVAGLEEAGFKVEVFDDIAGEPDDAVTERAIDRARAASAVAIVGIGGGSALDAAKMVALLTSNDGTVRDWLGAIAPPIPPTPLVLVPTTTGTGSEATRIAMITVDGAKKVVSCAQFVPLIAVLDESLVADLPAGVVASTGMDAVAHGVESILSTNRSSFTIAVATSAIQLLVVELEKAVLAGDSSARGKVLYAAHLAGLGLNAGVVVGHSLAYVIARHAPMPHGTSCALALPYCLAYNAGVESEISSHIALTLTQGRSNSLQAAAETVDALATTLELPRSLAAVGIAESELEQMAQETIDDYPRPNNPTPLEFAPLSRLFVHIHRGDVAGLWTTPIGGQL